MEIGKCVNISYINIRTYNSFVYFVRWFKLLFNRKTEVKKIIFQCFKDFWVSLSKCQMEERKKTWFKIEEWIWAVVSFGGCRFQIAMVLSKLPLHLRDIWRKLSTVHQISRRYSVDLFTDLLGELNDQKLLHESWRKSWL